MTDLGTVVAALAARFWILVAIVCFVAGGLLGYRLNAPDAIQQQQLDQLDGQGAAQDARDDAAIGQWQLVVGVMQAQLQQLVADSATRAALERTKVPVHQLAVAAANTSADSLGTVVQGLLDQITIRDSLHELDQVAISRLTLSVQAYDRVSANLAAAVAQEKELRWNAIGVAKDAIKRAKEPLLEGGGDVVTPIDKLSLTTRLWATARLTEHARLLVEGEWRAGQAAQLHVGGRVRVRILP